jgi:hypothetical protein
MKTQILILIITSSVALMGYACGTHSTQQLAELPPTPTHSVSQDQPPDIYVEADATVKLSKPLKLRWRIVNRSAKPIYIYSTLLEQPNTRLAEVNINEEERTIDVNFLRLEPLRHSIYNFPQAEFKRLAQGESLEGHLTGEKSSGQLTSYRTFEDRKLHPVKPTAGAWRVRCGVSYGYEVESVKTGLEELYRSGTEHPINPIVEWQKVAYSTPINVVFQQ